MANHKSAEKRIRQTKNAQREIVTIKQESKI